MNIYQLTFSPTGGTKKAAAALCAGLKGDVTEIDLLKSDSTAGVKLTADDLCVVAVPAFGGRVPAVSIDRLNTLTGNGAQVVLMAVYGNRHIDDTLVELLDTMTAAGFRCIAGVEAVAQHSLVTQFAAGRPDLADKEELAAYGMRIQTALEDGTLGQPPALPGNRPYKAFGGVGIHPDVNNHCKICGLCTRECPVGAIPAEQPNTTDTTKCIACMRCAAVCPYGARELNPAIDTGLYEKMKGICTERKPNKLYL